MSALCARCFKVVERACVDDTEREDCTNLEAHRALLTTAQREAAEALYHKRPERFDIVALRRWSLLVNASMVSHDVCGFKAIDSFCNIAGVGD